MSTAGHRSAGDALPPSPSAGGRSNARWRIALVAVITLAGLVWAVFPREDWVPVVRDGDVFRQVEGEFAGNDSCRPCHLDIYERQRASRKARTLRPLEDGSEPEALINGQIVRDRDTGAEYQAIHEDGQGYLKLTLGSQQAKMKLHWEFGSGGHAHGYIGVLDDGRLVDCRINWYREIDGWDFASGQDKTTPNLIDQPMGRTLTNREQARCFSCHTTRFYAKEVSAEGVRAEELQFTLRDLEVGIGCEVCHGPRADHVDLARLGRLADPPPPMSASQLNDLCGRCHSLNSLSVENKVIVRFQPWGLSQSQCFRRSEGGISCNTCHDPHDDARKEPEFYVARCLSCHTRDREINSISTLICPVNPRDGCVSCHMPRDTKAMLHVAFTDHRIRVVRDSKNSTRALPRDDPQASDELPMRAPIR